MSCRRSQTLIHYQSGSRHINVHSFSRLKMPRSVSEINKKRSTMKQKVFSCKELDRVSNRRCRTNQKFIDNPSAVSHKVDVLTRSGRRKYEMNLHEERRKSYQLCTKQFDVKPWCTIFLETQTNYDSSGVFSKYDLNIGLEDGRC